MLTLSVPALIVYSFIILELLIIINMKVIVHSVCKENDRMLRAMFELKHNLLSEKELNELWPKFFERSRRPL